MGSEISSTSCTPIGRHFVAPQIAVNEQKGHVLHSKMNIYLTLQSVTELTDGPKNHQNTNRTCSNFKSKKRTNFCEMTRSNLNARQSRYAYRSYWWDRALKIEKWWHLLWAVVNHLIFGCEVGVLLSILLMTCANQESSRSKRSIDVSIS